MQLSRSAECPECRIEKGERGALTVKELRRGDWGEDWWRFVAVGDWGCGSPGTDGLFIAWVGRGSGFWMQTPEGGVVSVVLEEKGEGKGRWMGER
jgi:hypothetical protein